MPVTDDIKTIEDKLWALLEASADFTAMVKVRNRVKMNVPGQRQVAPDPKGARANNDLPQVDIDRGRSRRQPFRPTATFGTFGTGTFPRIEERSQEFVITIVSDDRGDIVAGQVETAVEDAIIAGGPQLGLPTIIRLLEEIASTNELTSKGKAKGTLRRVVTSTVRLSLRKAV